MLEFDLEQQFKAKLAFIDLPDVKDINYWDAQAEYDPKIVKRENYNNFHLKMPSSFMRPRYLMDENANRCISEDRKWAKSDFRRTFSEMVDDVDRAIDELEIPQSIVANLHRALAPPSGRTIDNVDHKVLYLIYDKMRSWGYTAEDLH